MFICISSKMQMFAHLLSNDRPTVVKHVPRQTACNLVSSSKCYHLTIQTNYMRGGGEDGKTKENQS